MQPYRHEDVLQGYYPHAFTFLREDVPELSDDGPIDDDIPLEMCDPGNNELFIKSRVFVDENHSPKFRKEGSPRKRNDWRHDERIRQDDVRLRDRHYYKKKERKREEIPVWTLPPQ